MLNINLVFISDKLKEALQRADALEEELDQVKGEFLKIILLIQFCIIF